MEGLTEKLKAIVSTRIAFVAKEMKSGSTKVSMRSKFADVAEICEVFAGGGHFADQSYSLNETSGKR